MSLFDKSNPPANPWFKDGPTARRMAAESATHHGWDISFDYPPIPCRDFDYSASHPDYDGAEDANDNRFVHAATMDAIRAAIDQFIEEEEA